MRSFTSTILSPVLRVPFCPAGLSSKICLIKMPLITSPLLRRLPIPRPPTMLIPRDLPGSLKSSTLRKHTNHSFHLFVFAQLSISKLQHLCCLYNYVKVSDRSTHFLGWFQLLYEALSSPSPSSRSGRWGISLKNVKSERTLSNSWNI